MSFTCARCGTERDRTRTRDCLVCKADRRRAARSGPDGDAVRVSEAARMRRYRADNPDAARRMRDCSSAAAKANPEANQQRVKRYKMRKLAAYVEDVLPLVVLERSDGECGICGEDVDPLDFQVDHIIPLALGGEHSYANTQAAHPVCNARKQDRG